MGRDLFSTAAIAALFRAGDPRQFNLDFANDRDVIVEAASSSATAGTVDLSVFNASKVRGRPCVTYADYQAHLVLRGINKHLRRLFRLTTPSRDRIVRGVIETLLDATPMHVIRRDIRSFYETIPTAPLRDRLLHDSASSALVRKYLKDFFDAHCPVATGMGLPRGTGLSALLAELAMREFDSAIKATPGVFKYYRFSDDIVVFTTADPSIVTRSLESSLPVTMTFNTSKMLDVHFPRKKAPTTTAGFEFLGYNFFTQQTTDKTDSRIVRVSLSDRKLAKLKTRLILSFKDHAASPNWQLLVDRVRFLSSNYRIRRAGVSSLKDSPYVYSGIYYNYSACGAYSVRNGHFSSPPYDCAELKSIDGFYHGLLRHATRGNFGPPPQVLQLRRLSFSRSYSLRLKVRLTPDRVSQVKHCWRNN